MLQKLERELEGFNIIRLNFIIMKFFKRSIYPAIIITALLLSFGCNNSTDKKDKAEDVKTIATLFGSKSAAYVAVLFYILAVHFLFLWLDISFSK